MVELNWMSVGIYGVAGLIVSAGLLFAFGLALHVERSVRRYFAPTVFAMVILVPAVSVLVGHRDLSSYELHLITTQSNPVADWLQRLASVMIVGISLVRMIGHGFDRQRAHGGVYVMTGLFCMYFAVSVLCAFFGTVPARPSEQAFYVIVMMFALFLSRGDDMDLALQTAKFCLFLVILAGVVTMIVVPTMTQEHNILEMRLPLIDFRYAGLASNPNAMAPLGLVSLLMVVHRPFRSRMLTFLNIGLALFTVVLAQSQTTWIATVISLAILLQARYRWKLNKLPVMIAVTLAITAFVSWLVYEEVTSLTGSGLLQRLMSPSRYDEMMTLTGRDNIWLAAITEWKENPLFGYGPTMWGDDFRAMIGMNYAFSAHNQFVQALGVAGIVGLISLVFYLGCLVVGVLNVKGRERGFLMALLVSLLLRCLTETPLEIGSLFINELSLHLIMFVGLVSALAHQACVREQGPEIVLAENGSIVPIPCRPCRP